MQTAFGNVAFLKIPKCTSNNILLTLLNAYVLNSLIPVMTSSVVCPEIVEYDSVVSPEITPTAVTITKTTTAPSVLSVSNMYIL